MFENLEVFSRRLEELNVRLCEPATASDPALYAQLMKEYGELEPLVVHYRQYCAAEKDRSEAQEILADSASRDLHGLAQQQLKEAEQKLVQLTEKIKILLLPKDPQRRQKCNRRNPWRCGWGRGSPVFGCSVPYVHHVCTKPRLADRAFKCQ
jgi:protein subunit release factor A